MDDDDDMGFDFDADSPEEIENSNIPRNDSFDDYESAKNKQFDQSTLIEKYEKLQREAQKIDDVAREIRSTILICRQMEHCYSKRVASGPQRILKAHYLHNGAMIITMRVENSTEFEMRNWKMTVRCSPVHKNYQKAQMSETLELDTLLPGTSKSYELKVPEVELPVVFNFVMTRRIELDDFEKVFHINLDPISLTNWDLIQPAPKNADRDATRLAFEFSLRLPHHFIDLINGCPDTVSTSHVFRAILGVEHKDELKEQEQTFVIKDELMRIAVSRESTYYRLTIFASDSRQLQMLKNDLYAKLIVEMSKLKSRPNANREENIEVLQEFGDLEQLYESMVGSF